MTCTKCEQCAKENDLPDFELAMNRANDAITYAVEHIDHPQYERIKYPNRVAVGKYFMGIYEDEHAGPRIFIWSGDKPTDEALVYVNGQSMGIVNPDAAPPMINSKDMLDLTESFKNLLKKHFFKG